MQKSKGITSTVISVNDEMVQDHCEYPLLNHTHDESDVSVCDLLQLQQKQQTMALMGAKRPFEVDDSGVASTPHETSASKTNHPHPLPSGPVQSKHGDGESDVNPAYLLKKRVNTEQQLSCIYARQLLIRVLEQWTSTRPQEIGEFFQDAYASLPLDSPHTVSPRKLLKIIEIIDSCREYQSNMFRQATTTLHKVMLSEQQRIMDMTSSNSLIDVATVAPLSRSVVKEALIQLFEICNCPASDRDSTNAGSTSSSM